MSRYVGPILGLVLLGILVGFVLGLVTGLFVAPVTYTESEVAHLRSAQKDDWVYMVSAAYALDGSLADAKQRINRLDGDPSIAAKYVADVAQRAIERQDARNAKNTALLAVALGVGTPAMRNYIQLAATPQPSPRP